MKKTGVVIILGALMLHGQQVIYPEDSTKVRINQRFFMWCNNAFKSYSLRDSLGDGLWLIKEKRESLSRNTEIERAIGYYRNGKKDGFFYELAFPCKQAYKRKDFVNKIYWTLPYVYRHEEYRNGVKEGLEMENDIDSYGNVVSREVVTYEGGKKNGLRFTCNINGEILSVAEYEEDTLIRFYDFFEGGKVKSFVRKVSSGMSYEVSLYGDDGRIKERLWIDKGRLKKRSGYNSYGIEILVMEGDYYPLEGEENIDEKALRQVSSIKNRYELKEGWVRVYDDNGNLLREEYHSMKERGGQIVRPLWDVYFEEIHKQRQIKKVN